MKIAFSVEGDSSSPLNMWVSGADREARLVSAFFNGPLAGVAPETYTDPFSPAGASSGETTENDAKPASTDRSIGRNPIDGVPGALGA